MPALEPVIATLLANTEEFMASMDEAKVEMTAMSDTATVAGADAGAALSTGMVSGTEDAKGAVRGLDQDIGTLGADAEKTGGGFKGMLGNLGVPSALLGGWGELGIAVAAVGGVAIDLGTKFQSSERAIATAAGESVASANAIGNAMLATAGQTEFSANEQAKAYATVAGQLKSAEGQTLSTAQAMDVMNASGNLATATQTDLGSATSTVAGIMQAFQMSTKDAAGVSDVLFNASLATGQSVTTLGNALEKTKTKLGGMAPPLGQMGGLLVDMANHGETGRAAMAALTTTFTTLLKPAADMQKAQIALNVAMKNLPPNLQKAAAAYRDGSLTGKELYATTMSMSTSQAALWSAFKSSADAVTVSKEAQQKLGVTTVNNKGQFVGLSSVIGQLHDKIKGMTVAQATAELTALGFGSGSAKLVSIIQAGAGAFDKSTAAVTKTNSAQNAAAKQSGSLAVEMKIVRAALEDWEVRLSQFLIPVLKTFAEILLTSVVTSVHIVGDAIRTTIHVITDVVDWFKRGSAAAIAVAVVLASTLGPSFVALGVTAATSMAKMAAEAAANFAKMIASGAAWVAENAVHIAAVIASNLGVDASWVKSALAETTANAEMSTASAETAAAIAEAQSAIESSNLALQANADEMDISWATSNESMAASSAAAAAAVDTADADMAAATDAAAASIDTAIGATGIGLILIGLAAAAYELYKHWRQIWDGIKDVARLAWHFLKTGFEDLVHFVRGHMALMAVFSPLLLLVAHWKESWAVMKRIAQEAWSFIYDNVFTPLKRAILDIIGFFTALNNKWNAAWNEIAAGAVAMWRDIEAALGAMVTFFKNLPGQIVAALGDIGTTIWNGLKDAAQWVYDNVIKPVINFFKNLPDDIWHAMVWAASHLWSGLKTAAEWVYNNVIDPVYHWFIDLPGRVWRGMIWIASQIWSGLKTAAEWVYNNVIDPVYQWFVALPDRIWHAMVWTASHLWSGLKDAADWVYNNVIDPVYQWFVALPGRVWNGMVWVASEIWGGLKTAAQWVYDNVIDPVYHWFLALPGRVARGMVWVASNLWGGLKTAAEWVYNNVIDPVYHWFLALPSRVARGMVWTASQIWGSLKTAAQWIDSNVITPVLALFKSLPNEIVTSLGSVTTTIWKGFVGAAQWIDDNVIKPVLAFFKAMPNEIVQAFPNPLNLLKGIGESIIQGLWNGMKSVWNDVAGWLKNLGGFMQGLKGPISTDATLLTPHGMAIMQGLASGLQRGFSSAVVPALANITNGISGGVNAGINGRLSLNAGGVGAVSPSASAAPTTTILQVTSPINISGQTIAQVVTEYQLRQARSVGTVFAGFAGTNPTGTATSLNTNAIAR